MSALDDPRIASLYGFAQTFLRSPKSRRVDWKAMSLVLIHPSAKGVYRHVLAQGGDRMPDGTAMMIGDASRLASAGIPLDGRPYAVISAGDINAVLVIDPDRVAGGDKLDPKWPRVETPPGVDEECVNAAGVARLYYELPLDDCDCEPALLDDVLRFRRYVDALRAAEAVKVAPRGLDDILWDAAGEAVEALLATAGDAPRTSFKQTALFDAIFAKSRAWSPVRLVEQETRPR